MREIRAEKVKKVVAELCIKTNYELRADIFKSLQQTLEEETSSRAKKIIKQLLENAKIAREERMPLCQDTGMVTAFLKLGQEVKIKGDLYKAVNKGVQEGYKKGYLRMSIVEDPLKRKNTGNNTPAVIHTEIVPGDKLKIIISPKGFGSENMSCSTMLAPFAGEEGVKNFVLNTVKKGGANACPPLIIGIGLGGTMEKAALIAKQSLFRPLGSHNQKKHIADLEKSLLEEINKLGIGPQGLGGKTTALAVNMETFPTHIAGFPVAVNICCYALRWEEKIL